MKSFFPDKYILSLITALLLMTACGTLPKEDLQGYPVRSAKAEAIGSPYTGSFEKAMYRTTLDIGKNHLTGYLLIKKTSDSGFRLAFANDIGMTWFDLELVNREMIKHAVFGPLDKKALLRIFATDFDALLRSVNANPGPKIYPVAEGKHYALIGGTSPFNKYRIDYKDIKEGKARHITVINPAIRLTLSMKLLGL